MKRYTPIIIWALLVAVAFSGLVTLTSRGPEVVLKSYPQSQQFQNHLNDIYDELGRTVLNPINLEEAEKKLSVTPAEIQEYRTYYGGLAEQIDNIQMQYEDRIREAETKVTVKQALVDERDGKIEDIRKNFEDESYVEGKILSEKKRQLGRLVHNYKYNSAMMEIPLAYSLWPVGGGDTIEGGEVKGPIGYERKFNTQNGYLKLSGMDSSFTDINYYEETSTYMDNAVQQGEGVTLSSDDLQAIAQPAVLYEGMVAVLKSAFQEGGVLYEEAKTYRSIKIMLIVSGLAAIASIIMLFTVWKFKWTWFVDLPFTKRYDSFRIDLKAGIFLFLLLSLVNFTREISGRLNNMASGGYSFSIPNAVFMFTMSAIVIAFLAFQIGNAITRYQQPGKLENDFKNSYTMQLMDSVKEVFLNRSIAIQTLLLLIGFFLAGVGFVGSMLAVELFMIYVLCVLFIGLPILFIYMRRMGYLNKIFKATEDMAAGRLNSDIKVIGRSPFANHAANLNNLREGVEQSVTSQAKSERLKTELITNVSHDLRTPLTSIITYTDLLKNPNLTDEERWEYVDVLDRKSQRLKTLIEDLFEVSKMSSGTMELYKQRIDLSQLVQQAIGEHAEKMAEIPLDFRISVPEKPVPAVLDGQRWWRMLDNLIGNALKYSLPGTRVYVTLREDDGMAELVVKNITAYELNENVDELYERFKRGDASRHTDGSGLGLAIAQSIVDMHGGTMAIDVDGDLFKVTVRVPLA
ncbi:sensor histidine kinase [Sporosarcina aquimarina]|uniref:histidine kinase n=1 Tax=Sporosarcina aquimarina TaxID=114975 RepID=A0ABU4FUV1_9BACL|nr:HAMP domain-containing sensor histidine kinase [Sporosarcina aquimarina]MDW0108500.1 HAMP domain-containing sensor histidine kinase [Sporosarcina aquimarina]